MHRLVLPGFEDGQAIAFLPHARPTPHGNIAYLTDKLVQHYLRILQNERPAAPCVRRLPSVNIRPVPGKPVRKQPQRSTARPSPVPVPLLIGVSLLRGSYFATIKAFDMRHDEGGFMWAVRVDNGVRCKSKLPLPAKGHLRESVRRRSKQVVRGHTASRHREGNDLAADEFIPV